MHLFEELFLLERLDHLIRIKATGCPAALADRLDSSQRTVERVIAKLKEMGFPIAYDKHRETYYYKEEVKLSFEMLVGKEEVLRIKGGEAYFMKVCASMREVLPEFKMMPDYVPSSNTSTCGYAAQ